MRQTVVLCDLHEGSAHATASVRVLVDGVARRLDVCAEHAAWLGSLPSDVDGDDQTYELLGEGTVRRLTPARPAGGPAVPGANTRAGSRRSLRAERAAARDWARLQGSEVSDRGRLPTGLLERYREQAG